MEEKGGICVFPLRMSGISDHVVVDVAEHTHSDCFQLMYCKGGRGDVFVGNQCFSAEKGHIYLAPPLVPHGMVQKNGLRLGEIKFTVENRVLYDAVAHLPRDIDVDGEFLLASAMGDVLREGLSDMPYGYETACSTLLLLLFRLLRRHGIVLAKGAEKFYAISDYRKEIDLLAVSKYIEEHLGDRLTLETIAETVHFSSSYLSARFKEKWGMPLMQYVNQRRIARARELLVTSEHTLGEIATAVGFQSIHYFSRFFKQKVGISPNAYRVSYGKK